jgi:hypothetical protein
MLKFYGNMWVVSGRLKEIQQKTFAGELSEAIYLLCWQITAYGESYVKLLEKNENYRLAISLLTQV